MTYTPENNGNVIAVDPETFFNANFANEANFTNLYLKFAFN